LECRLIVAGKQLSTPLTFDKLIELWRAGAAKPFEEIKRFVEKELGPVQLEGIAPYIKLKENLAVIEYSLKIGSEKTSAVIVCSENPEVALEEFRKLKESRAIEPRSIAAPFSELLKEASQNNYFNVKGIPELEDALKEAAELANDIIDYYPRGDARKVLELLVKSAFLFSIFHVLWPLSLGIFLDLLIGNLPACFMQLRLLVETAAKALLVDHEMKFRSDVFTGVEELEKSLRRKEAASPCATSTSRVLRRLSELKLVGERTAEEAVKLWNKLSVEWAHFRGAFIRTRKALEMFGDLPSFRYVLPAGLGEEDSEDLRELAECVARTRRLLRTFYSSWLKLLEEQLPEAASMFERR
jgi:hypothetical protein